MCWSITSAGRSGLNRSSTTTRSRSKPKFAARCSRRCGVVMPRCRSCLSKGVVPSSTFHPLPPAASIACLAFETAGRGVRVNATAPGGTEAPPRLIPRNTAEQSAEEKVWYQQIVDQTLDSSLMKRYGTLDEQASAILFLASDEASYITGMIMPVGGGDQG